MRKLFMQVEFDPKFYGGDYKDVGIMALIPVELVEEKGMDIAFRQTTGYDPVHIIHYSEDEQYDAMGEFVEDPEEDVEDQAVEIPAVEAIELPETIEIELPEVGEVEIEPVPEIKVSNRWTKLSKESNEARP